LTLFLACPSGEPVKITVPPGASTATIADSLQAHGVIRSRAAFIALSRVLGFDRKLRHGSYELRPGTGALAALRALSEPGVTAVRITIPEGWRLIDIARLLEDKGICPDPEFLAACRDPDVLTELGIAGRDAEGWLFPDTYEFELGTPAADVVLRLGRRFAKVLAELKAELPEPPPDDHETVILASIVEKEAVIADEAPLIAGVFLNRLRRGMPLQSCATVQYALPEHRTNLTYADTRTPSPYNTYLHLGLPPGPISNPGRNALRAALRPADTDYRFFVARGDGSHEFSKTLREHEKAKRRISRGAR
jgi:UPF0755 protein